MNIEVLDKNKIPYIVFTSKVYAQLQALNNTKWAKTYEYMYIGEVVYIPETNTYAVANIRLIPQCNISTMHCETDDDKYPIWLQENYNIQERKRVRFHGHSHVNMGTAPSGDDNQAINKMMNYVSDYFIQFILNLKGEYTLNIYSKKDNLIYRNLKYKIITDEGHLIDEHNNIIKNEDVSITEIKVQENGDIELAKGLFFNTNTLSVSLHDGNISLEKGGTITVNPTILEKLTKEYETEAEKLKIPFPNGTISNIKQSSYTYDYDFRNYCGNSYYQRTIEPDMDDLCKVCTATGKHACDDCECLDCVYSGKAVSIQHCKECKHYPEKRINNVNKTKETKKKETKKKGTKKENESK